MEIPDDIRHKIGIGIKNPPEVKATTTPLPRGMIADRLTEPEKLELLFQHYLDNKEKIMKIPMSLISSLAIRGKTLPVPVVMISNPGNQKSTIMDIIQPLDAAYVADEFSPKAFVSGKPKIDEKTGKEMQLIDQIRDKLVLTSDLAPVINSPNWKENIGKLTRLFDGRGFQKLDGHGVHGTLEKTRFNFLGAIPKLSQERMREMAHMGSRLWTLRIIPKALTVDQIIEAGLKMLNQDQTIEDKLKILSNGIAAFLETRNFAVNSISWNHQKDSRDAHLLIAQMASLTRTLRSGVGDDAEVVSEAIPRAIEGFYTLSQGEAINQGRNWIQKEDVLPAVRLSIDTTTSERRTTFLSLIEKQEMKIKELKIVLRPALGIIEDAKFNKKIDHMLDTALREMQIIKLIKIKNGIATLDEQIKRLQVAVEDEISEAVSW